MPELPEVEAVVRRLRPAVQDAAIRSVKVLRPRITHPQPASALDLACGQTIQVVERRGKNILLRLSAGRVIRVHLRMTGNLTVAPTHLLHNHTARVVFGLNDGRGIAFEDPRALGCVHAYTEAEAEAALEDIGVDPLSAEFTPAFLTRAASRSRKPVKVFLMDQHPIAGLGNIYAAESLFEARIHPAVPACQVTRPKLGKLHAAVQRVLTRAIPEAVASYSQPGSHEGMSWSVYDREGAPCPRCRRPISRIKQAGRSTYYCSTCQK